MLTWDGMQKQKRASLWQSQAGTAVQRDCRWRDLTAILLASLVMSACTASARVPANLSKQDSPAPTSMNLAYGQSLRGIVQFRQTLPYRAAAFRQLIR